MDAIRFRAATPDDAAALGLLHVASWREAYAGLLPGALLDALSPDDRSAMWHMALHAGDTAVVLAEQAGATIGFGACGDQRDDHLAARGFDGEIGALYVLRSHQRIGIGGALLGLTARELLRRGRVAATLWVLRGNRPARQFYERQAGVAVAERSDAQSGTTLPELAYGWSDLARLVR